MNRLSERLSKFQESKKKALVAYLVAGDPDINTTLNLMELLVSSGVDIIEIGVPFTDPIAEGPIIQKAHDRALKNNISLDQIFDLVHEFRKKDDETPIVLMGYLNTFIFYKHLIKNNDNNHVDSILVVDIPGELDLSNYGVSNKNINTISLISPTTKKNRVKSIAENSSGFIYYVTLRGVTGSSNLDIQEIKTNIQEIKQYSHLPVLAGFGIKSAEDAKLLSECSDGIVIGSSIVQMIEENSISKEFGRIENYINEIRQAIE